MTDMVADKLGNLYVTQTDRVRKITAVGVVSTLAGSGNLTGSSTFVDGSASVARFGDLRSIAIAPNGTLFVADSANSAIRIIGIDGAVSTYGGGPNLRGYLDGPLNEARFEYPSAITFDTVGNLYVIDDISTNSQGLCAKSADFVIRKISLAGMVTTIHKSRRFFGPVKFAVDNTGNLYVPFTDYLLPNIAPGLCPGAWYEPIRSYIRKISPEGTATLWAGSDTSSLGNEPATDGPRLNARFDAVRGIVFDGETGHLFVADPRVGSIRRISTDGMVKTVVGQLKPFVYPPVFPPENTLTLGPLPGVVPFADALAIGPKTKIFIGATNWNSPARVVLTTKP